MHSVNLNWTSRKRPPCWTTCTKLAPGQPEQLSCTPVGKVRATQSAGPSRPWAGEVVKGELVMNPFPPTPATQERTYIAQFLPGGGGEDCAPWVQFNKAIFRTVLSLANNKHIPSAAWAKITRHWMTKSDRNYRMSWRHKELKGTMKGGILNVQNQSWPWKELMRGKVM